MVTIFRRFGRSSGISALEFSIVLSAVCIPFLVSMPSLQRNISIPFETVGNNIFASAESPGASAGSGKGGGTDEGGAGPDCEEHPEQCTDDGDE